MNILPPAPTTCNEYLGKSLGYCPGAVQVTAVDGRGFCTDHARERGL